VEEIFSKMQAFGITVKDFQSPKANRAGKAGRTAKYKPPLKTPKIASKAVKPVAAKYRGPNGETSFGRGLPPKLLASLVAQVQNKESFAVNPK